MRNIDEINSNRINYFKKKSQKSDKKVDLCKKYFYKLNLSPKKCNIFQLMENGLSNQDELDQVDSICTKVINHKYLLEKKKRECLKSMILHHKQIPEKWIFQSNYKNLLNKVMSDPIVLNYVIESKDIFKKRSTSLSIDISEVEKNMKENNSSPKFISYINPYSKNYEDSLEKHKLMREYCYNIKKKKNIIHPNNKNAKDIKLAENTNNNEETIKNINKNYYLNTEANKEYLLPCIYPKKKNKKEDKDETFMMTSLYYDENNINKENKPNKKTLIKKGNIINNESLNKEKNNNDMKKEKIELPKIE